MANVNAPFGFRPIRHAAGGKILTKEYPIASTYGTNIFCGDPVKITTDGVLNLAAAGDRAIGIFRGVRYKNSAGEQIFSKYWPASTTATSIVATVITDPFVIYEIQGDVTVAAQTQVGGLADHVAGTGSTITGMSGSYLNVASLGTSALAYRVLRLSNRSDNDTAAAYAVYEVIFAEHEFTSAGITAGATGTVGIGI